MTRSNVQAYCEWDLPGLLAHVDCAGAVVVVDVLSFSTAVDIAVSQGATVLPFPSGDREAAAKAAAAAGAVLAGRRGSAADVLSLSPQSLLRIRPGTRLLLPSPNGSRLSHAAGPVPLFAGCLRNAGAVARAARQIAGERPVAVIPAGERWPDGSLRPAVEDLLGAGAILEALALTPSPEALIACEAFRAARADLAGIISASVSGRELEDRGFAGDLELAVELDVSETAPRLSDGVFVGHG